MKRYEGGPTVSQRSNSQSPMFRYHLRTLLIVLGVAPPVLAGAIVTIPIWPVLLAFLLVLLVVLGVAMSLERITRP